MNDSPGWASPGSSPSEGDRPDAAAPEGAEGTPPADPAGPPAAGSKWSKEQPPAGQWSAPAPGGTASGAPAPGGPAPQPGTGWGSPRTGPGTPQGGPYGGQQGAQPGWGGAWGTPPAAKPGVIPLRPLAVGEILDGAVTTMRRHWRTVLGITLAFAVVVQLAITLVQGLAFPDLGTTPEDPADLDALADSLTTSLAASGTAQVITLIGTIIATAPLTMVFSRAVLGRPSSVGEVWREARPQLLRLAGLTVTLTAMFLGILTAGVLPGALAGNAALLVVGLLAAVGVCAWLWARFALASPALMLEKQTVGKALGRSAKLVRGSWWRVFGIGLLTQILTGIVAGIIVLPFTVLAMMFTDGGVSGFMSGTAGTGLGWGFLIVSAIGAVIALTITLPINAGVNVLLYIDQRIRREALDLELARAAGLQDYGDPARPDTGT
jgi:hypothetical protein